MKRAQTLVIFDMDGTLVDGHKIDTACFDRAIQETTGLAITVDQWLHFKEVTAQGILREALGEASPGHDAVIDRVRDCFLAKLHASHAADPDSIPPFAHAVGLLAHLKESPDFGVAIATGCWQETAHFKLRAAGFDLDGIPLASASDRYSRAEIITLAAERAGMPVEQAVYVGDGVWDLRATRQLGIPFIGVGRKTDVLREAGARHISETFEVGAFLQRVAEARAAHAGLLETN